MPMVNVNGVFMGANLKTSTFDGVSKTSLYVDVYQPTAQGSDKVVQLKSDNLDLLNTLNDEFDMGSVFEATANVNAYQNKAYFKLIDLVR